MNAKYIAPIVSCALYLALIVIFILNSGAGHDWGISALFIVSFPLGLVGLGLDILLPDRGLLILSPILGLLQYGVIGYWLGRRIDRNQNPPGNTKSR